MESKEDRGNPTGEGAPPRRVIKRYSNRKLYDTRDSRYVTLLQIAEFVRAGEEVQIIDNTTKEDLTEVTLAQILFEEQKQKSSKSAVPLERLRELLSTQTERVLSDLREGPIGRLIPGARTGEEGEEGDADAGAQEEGRPQAAAKKEKSARLVEQARETLEELQHGIDERIRAILPSLRPWQQLEAEVKRLTERLDAIEKRLGNDGDSK